MRQIQRFPAANHLRGFESPAKGPTGFERCSVDIALKCLVGPRNDNPRKIRRARYRNPLDRYAIPPPKCSTVSKDMPPAALVKSVATKLKGYEFWRTALGAAKYVVAPMVDQSEFAWRKLTRNYGAELCYTPMFHARMFGDPQNDAYRKDMWGTGSGDRPLIVQFCANDPAQLLAAAKIVEDKCDAVDINLGCPQHIARRGHYGSFLQDDWKLIESMVRILDEKLAIPVTCKIRIFPDVQKTIAYAQMLEKAGCQLLTVHGRVREQKGHNTGLADWEQIKQVKQAVNIPVFANGNVLYFEDVQKCLDFTGVDGVMSAEATLYNPALFSGKIVPIWEIVDEYLEICREHKEVNKIVYMRAHLFKLYKPCLSIYTDLRERLGKARTEADFEIVIGELNARLKADAEKENNSVEFTTDEEGVRKYPHWICQAYVRPPNVHNKRKEDREEAPEADCKRKSTQDALPSDNARRTSERLLCHDCPNVASSKCPFSSCKQCCHSKHPKDASVEGSPACEIHYPRQPTEAPASVTA